MQLKDVPKIASALNHIYAQSKGKMVSVHDKPIGPIFLKHNIFSNDRAKVIDYLKSKVIWHEGERSGLKYKWIGDVPDTTKLATDIVEFYIAKKQKNPKTTITVKKEIVDVEKKELKIVKPFNIKTVGDKGFVIYESKIYEALICMVQKMPNLKMTFDVILSVNNHNIIISNPVFFPEIHMLCVFLEKTYAKFKYENPIQLSSPEISSSFINNIIDENTSAENKTNNALIKAN